MVFVYTLSIFLSAFLLFMVQPMVGRIFLPLVGGAPAAWNTCMFFFQLLLLGGYAYTHIAFARLKTGSQMLLHLAFAVGAALTLPVVYRGSGAVPEEPALWLLLQLVLTARLVSAGSLLGIQVLDHLIVGDGRYVSFADQGWLNGEGARS